MTNQLTIRKARYTDAREIAEIYAWYVANTVWTFEYESPDADEMALRMRVIQEHYPYLVAERNGEILGYAYAGPLNERAAYDWSVETTIYLRHDLTRAGIGTALYNALLDSLSSRHFQMAFADITASNTVSIAFHKALGFSLCGTLEHSGWKNGKWYGICWMQRPLERTDEAPEPIVPIAVSDDNERKKK